MQGKILELVENIEQVIIGKKVIVIKIILAMLCNGHVLIEDMPGTGKTQLILALSQSVAGVFHRLQMTPDVTSSDICGFNIMDPATKRTIYKEGVVNCNFLLADEINRAPAKVQSGLLEAMEEKQVSIDGQLHCLPAPFLTFATQNPIESHGTYNLPEAQLDRFFMKIAMGYPSYNHEMEILDKNKENVVKTQLDSVWEISDVVAMQKQVEEVKGSDEVKRYILDLVHMTRGNEEVALGIGPRGSINLYKAAKGLAFLDERNNITTNDVRAIAADILAHRLILSPKGKEKYKDSREYINHIML